MSECLTQRVLCFVACVHARTTDSDVTVFRGWALARSRHSPLRRRDAEPSIPQGRRWHKPATTLRPPPCAGMWGSRDSLPPPTCRGKKKQGDCTLARNAPKHSADSPALMAGQKSCLTCRDFARSHGESVTRTFGTHSVSHNLNTTPGAIMRLDERPV